MGSETTGSKIEKLPVACLARDKTQADVFKPVFFDAVRPGAKRV